MIKKFKKGAASFYIVAFSTLILVVIATSFATVIMSEISRTANDDLSQSAYDSALAGIEDAKVAYANYRRCKEAGVSAKAPSSVDGTTKPTCGEIVWWVEQDTKQENRCAMVGHILGKIPKNSTEEVTIGGIEKTGAGGETTTNQAYTCAIIDTDVRDYRTTLNEDKKTQTLRASMGTEDVNAADTIKIHWYSTAGQEKFKSNLLSAQLGQISSGRLILPKLSAGIVIPPMVELQIVQTPKTFSLEDFDKVGNNQTDRATLFLAPTNSETNAKNNGENYIGVWNGSANIVSSTQVVKTNDHVVENKAFLVYCKEEGDFYCDVEIKLPNVYPHGGNSARSNNTFIISFSLPYQRPKTEFSIELCKGSECKTPIPTNTTTGDESANKKITNVQVALDVTGRANDLYRRVETRLESEDTTFGIGYPYYALEILGNGGLEKALKVSSEYNFPF